MCRIYPQLHFLLCCTSQGEQQTGMEQKLEQSASPANNKSWKSKRKKQKIIINTKTIIMGNLLYTIAVILVIVWAIGYLGFQTGGIIHVLLVIAVIAVLIRLIRGNNPL
jgi:hypothetical protein